MQTQCDQTWRNFTALAKFKKVFWQLLKLYLLFGKTLNLLWQIFYAIGQIYIPINGKILKKSSHLVTLHTEYVIWPRTRLRPFKRKGATLGRRQRDRSVCTELKKVSMNGALPQVFIYLPAGHAFLGYKQIDVKGTFVKLFLL